jgi:hypothetical protein
MAAAPDDARLVEQLTSTLRATTPAERKSIRALDAMLRKADTGHDIGDALARVSRTTAKLPDPETGTGADTPSRVINIDAEFRVFRRETPLAGAALDLSSPSWARGAQVAQTLGPFIGIDGRQFWFDFYSIAVLVPIYLAGDSTPAMLIPMREYRRRSTNLPIGTLLEQLRRAQFTLPAGSLWIRANLFNGAATPGAYAGLKITGGTLAFPILPIDVAGRITIPAGGNCALDLTLSPVIAPAPADTQAGIDAAKSALTLPATCAFTLAAAGITIRGVDRTSCTAYATDVAMTWRGVTSALFVDELNAVIMPMESTPDRFDVRQSASPFATLADSAAINRSGWALPVSVIDVATPPELAGNGSLAMNLGSGLTITWRGLRDGPVKLRSPWLSVSAGALLITDTNASNRYAHQRLRLWREDLARPRCELALQYTDLFTLTYVSAALGNEVLLTQADANASIDRPVDVRGVPLSVHTLKSLFALGYTDQQQTAVLYDDNILVDSLDPSVIRPVSPGKLTSIAIRNALFSVTPVNSALFFGVLRDEEMVETGTLLLGMGLYTLLPTLPDPYAANVGFMRQGRGRGSRVAQITQLLVATVKWTKAASDEAADIVSTAFAFAPAGSTAASIAIWNQARVQQGLAQLGGRGGSVATAAAQAAAPPQSSAASRRPRSEDAWREKFDRFNQEQFALLDVSSNADQMGVSFAWFNPREADADKGEFGRVYGGGGGGNTPQAQAFPLEIRELDLSAQSRFIRAFTVPQISWEPLMNETPPQLVDDPPLGTNLYPNDGGPTRLLNNATDVVPLAPIPVSEHLVKDFAERPTGFTGAMLTLPFGLRAFAEFSRVNQFQAALDAAKLTFNRPVYATSGLRGGLQFRVDAPKHPAESANFKGGTLQIENVHTAAGVPTPAGTLGHSVGTIFNGEFFFGAGSGHKDRGVPVPRMDLSGYGASIFSRWQNPNAAVAATSQVFFDVWVGRTGHEVVQVRSLIYPWGIRVVRTITILRGSSGIVHRIDSGWQAETPGIYDFSFSVYPSPGVFTPLLTIPNPYEFHPGVVKGLFNVRNIEETKDVAPFEETWVKANGEMYVDENGAKQIVDGSTPIDERSPGVILQPLYFDADIQIDGVTSGANNGRVPSTKMLGYVQLAPRGEPISPVLFAELLSRQITPIGGKVDCEMVIAGSGQGMRVSRVDVNNANRLGDNAPIFVSAARGAVVLPKDGSWSVVEHKQSTGEVVPLAPQKTVPLIRRGALTNALAQTTDANAATDQFRLANPVELVRAPIANTLNYGLLQSTGTQKALFRLPAFRQGVNDLLSATPDFADAYRIVNTKGIFPNVQDTIPLVLNNYKTKILEEGYRLLDEVNPDTAFEQLMPPGPLYLINETFLKLYVEYNKTDKQGASLGSSLMQYGFDATAAAEGKRWLSKLNDISMVVDLGPLKRLMMVRGKFDAEKGATPGFAGPKLEFCDELQPVVDILQILLQLSEGDYKAAFDKGMEVAMSNSADSWSYAFSAKKEIPLVRFPPGPAYDAPQVPLKLEARLAIGVYFNEVLKITDDPKDLIPSAGAFLQFGGKLSVMCFSVAAATIYANGSVDLRTSADIKTGPRLWMKFGFGAELVVGLPVVANVSVTFIVGVEIDIATEDFSIMAFMLFRGRAEILGGIVTITIMIEAKGGVRRLGSGSSAKTEMVAQVTFAIDISIFLVINISFSESWQEDRQIA